MTDIPVLETERLILGPPSAADLDPYAEMYADAEAMRYIGFGRPMSRAESWRSIATIIGHWHIRGHGFWFVHRKSDGAFIGRVGLWSPEGWPGIEVGWMVHPRHWGHGFATEAALAARDHGFQTLGVPRLISLIRPENTASIRVAEKIGHALAETIEIDGGPALIYASERGAAPATRSTPK